MSFERRVRTGESLLGLLVRLPVDARTLVQLDQRFTFIVVDLIDGPFSELDLTRLIDVAHSLNRAVVVRADDSLGAFAGSRLQQFGVDGVVHHRLSDGGRGNLRLGDFETARELRVVHSPWQVRGRSSNDSSLIAVDAEAALASVLTSFAAGAVRAGATEQLVMLPGMLGDARVFGGVVESLEGHATCRPERIDLDDTIAGIAESVLAAAPDRFGLVGHSLGAIVALEMYRHAPSRITRLALLNASARPASHAQRDAWASLADRVERGEFAAIATELARLNVGPGGAEEHVELSVDMAVRVGPAGFLRQLSAQASRADSLPTLCDISVPVLVVSGSADTVCPPEIQTELAAAISDGGGDVTHVTIDGGGHMSPLEHPVAVAGFLLEWLHSGAAI